MSFHHIEKVIVGSHIDEIDGIKTSPGFYYHIMLPNELRMRIIGHDDEPNRITVAIMERDSDLIIGECFMTTADQWSRVFDLLVEYSNKKPNKERTFYD